MGYQELGERMWVAACLEAVAAAAGALGHAECSAQLLSVTETVRIQIGLPTWFADHAAFEKSTVAARTELGEEAFAAAWAAGAAMTLDEAMAMVEATAETAVAAPRENVEHAAPFGLSPREIEVLRLMAQGTTDQETAEILSVSRRTVHSHVGSILNKLAAQNRTAAVAAAVRLGLA
jgi:DNA-binding CsgD family transcriptional regulator